MTVAAGAPAGSGPTSAAAARADEGANRHIRGSSLLLLGRGLSLFLNLATQVIAVRYLSKAGYGAFAYGLALSSIAETVTSPAHNQVLGRFLAHHDERREPDKVVGTIVLQLVGVCGLGLTAVAAVWVARGALAGSLDGPGAATIVVVLVALAPLEGIDDIFEALFAVFARPRAIFVRKHLLAPGLRLAVVALLVLVGGGTLFLAVGYVVAVALGLVAYAAVLVPVLRQRGLLAHLRPGRFSMPVRAVLAATAPMLTVELVYHALSNIALVVLGQRRGAEQVAAMRAVFPAARLNSLVAASFTLLFVPLASRLWARGDRRGLHEAYSRTVAWMAVLGLPVLLVTAPLASTTTVALFGGRYGGSAPAMALLSVGYYVAGALGLSVVLLQAVGRLRALALVNAVVAAVCVAVTVVVAPAHGATGVALVSALALCAHAVSGQVIAARSLGTPVLDLRLRRVGAVVLAGVAAVGAVVAVADPGVVVAVPLVAVVSSAALVAARRQLDVSETFPELARLPVLGRVLTAGAGDEPAARRPLGGLVHSRAFSVGLRVLESVPAGPPTLPIVTYHRVAPRQGDPFYPGLISAGPAEFEAQIAHLARTRRPLRADELLAVRRGEAPLPERAVLVTFDDGYRDLAEHALPILRRHGVPAVVFVPTGFVDDRSTWFWWDRLYTALATTTQPALSLPGGEVLPLGDRARATAAFRHLRPRLKAMAHHEAAATVEELADRLAAPPPPPAVLGWDELRAIASDELVVAPHTVSHPLLTRVPPEEVAVEIATSVDRIRDELGEAPPIFAYPSGAHDAAVVAAAEAAGIEVAVTTDRGVNDLRRADWLRLRRINAGRFGVPALRAQLAPALVHVPKWTGPQRA